MKGKGAKKLSLHRMLTFIMLLCWMIPIGLLFIFLSYYTVTQTRYQMEQSVQKNVGTAAVEASRQLSELVDDSRKASVDGEIYGAYQAYRKDENHIGLYESITMYLSRQYRYNNGLLSTIVYLNEDAEYIYAANHTQAGGSAQRMRDFRDNAKQGIDIVAKTAGTGIWLYSTDENLYMVRNMVDKTFSPFAVIVMVLNKEKIFGDLLTIPGAKSVTVSLNDEVVQLYGENEEGETQAFILPEYTKLSRGEITLYQGQRDTTFYGRESLRSINMVYAVQVPKQFFSYQLADLWGLVVILAICLIPFSVFLWLFLRKQILNPIKGLKKASEELQKEPGYIVRENVPNQEFEYLTEAFNGMSMKLRTQFEHIYNEELALKDARIMALQSQINPHFLNNTLEIINWENRLGQNAKVSRMIESLSVLLDAAMDRKSKHLVPLSQEMMYVEAYLFIISERFGKRLVVEKEIDPQLLKEEVPRLIMQPIIENAVEHGMSPQQTSEISIRIFKKGEKMHVEVKNNMPMSEQDKEKVLWLLSGVDGDTERSVHLGIRNVDMRLRMIYGEGHGFSITSDDHSTISSFSVPVVGDDD